MGFENSIFSLVCRRFVRWFVRFFWFAWRARIRCADGPNAGRQHPNGLGHAGFCQRNREQTAFFRHFGLVERALDGKSALLPATYDFFVLGAISDVWAARPRRIYLGASRFAPRFFVAAFGIFRVAFRFGARDFGGWTFRVGPPRTIAFAQWHRRVQLLERPVRRVERHRNGCGVLDDLGLEPPKCQPFHFGVGER